MERKVTTTVLHEAARLSAELESGATLKFYRPDQPRGVRYVLRLRTDEDRRRGMADSVLAHVSAGLLCEVTRPPVEHLDRAHFGCKKVDPVPNSFGATAARLAFELRSNGGTIECTHPTLPPCAFGAAHSSLEAAIEEKLCAGYLVSVKPSESTTSSLYAIDYAAAERSVLAFMKQARFPVVRTSRGKRKPLSVCAMRALRRKTLIWPNGLMGYVGGAIYRQHEGLCLLVYHTGRTSSQRPTVYTAQRLADLGVRCLVDGSETGESTPCWTEVEPVWPVPAVRPLSDARMNALVRPLSDARMNALVGHELHWPGGNVRLCVGLIQTHDTLCVAVRPIRDDGSVVPARESEKYYTAKNLAYDRVVCKKRTGVDAGVEFKCWEEPETAAEDKPSAPIRAPTRVRAPLDDAAMRLLAGKLLMWPCGDTRLCVGVAHMYGGLCAQLAQADGMEPIKAMNAKELAIAGIRWRVVNNSDGPYNPCWTEA